MKNNLLKAKNKILQRIAEEEYDFDARSRSTRIVRNLSETLLLPESEEIQDIVYNIVSNFFSDYDQDSLDGLSEYIIQAFKQRGLLPNNIINNSVEKNEYIDFEKCDNMLVMALDTFLGFYLEDIMSSETINRLYNIIEDDLDLAIENRSSVALASYLLKTFCSYTRIQDAVMEYIEQEYKS